MTHPENEPLTQWLAREVPETVLEPELPIIDPHHHCGICARRQRNRS